MTEVVRDLRRLEHILEALEKIKEFSSGIETVEDFINCDLERSAIERQIMIIGEATAHLSEKVKEMSSDTQWRKIKGLRNILAHEYFSVDPVEVWGIVENRVPELYPVVQSLMKELQKKS